MNGHFSTHFTLLWDFRRSEYYEAEARRPNRYGHAETSACEILVDKYVINDFRTDYPETLTLQDPSAAFAKSSCSIRGDNYTRSLRESLSIQG